MEYTILRRVLLYYYGGTPRRSHRTVHIHTRVTVPHTEWV